MTTEPLEQTWLVLKELITDLKKQSIEVSSDINKDMQILKSLINFYIEDPSHPDRMKELSRINNITNITQDTLIDLAETVNENYKKKWVNKLLQASRGETVYKPANTKTRFIIGTPPGFDSARITFKEPIAEERLQEIAEYENLILEFETDNIVAIFGDSKNIKKGLKDMASFF